MRVYECACEIPFLTGVVLILRYRYYTSIFLIYRHVIRYRCHGDFFVLVVAQGRDSKLAKQSLSCTKTSPPSMSTCERLVAIADGLENTCLA